MRPSTRTSRACLRGLRAAALLLGCLLPLPRAAAALPVTVEVRVPDPEGNLAVARRRALALSLAEAVEVVVSRHVPAEELEQRRGDLRSIFFSQPAPFVLRYGITAERYAGEDLVLSLDADVSREKVLGELRTRGFTVRVLPAHPRILVAALGEPEAVVAAQALRRRLDAEGLASRVLPALGVSAVDEAQLATWALDAGCHVAFGVSVPAEGVAEDRLEAGDDAVSDDDTAAWGPALAPRVTADATALGWVVDGRTHGVLGRAEAVARGEAPDDAEARTRAVARAGERLAYALLAQLEQSGWVPGEVARVVDLEVQGLPGPSAVEALQHALPRVADVRRAELREVGYRSALWRLEALSTGVGWDALLSAVRLPRGTLVLVAGENMVPADSPERVRALWVEP